jgi:hypothetical protein
MLSKKLAVLTAGSSQELIELAQYMSMVALVQINQELVADGAGMGELRRRMLRGWCSDGFVVLLERRRTVRCLFLFGEAKQLRGISEKEQYIWPEEGDTTWASNIPLGQREILPIIRIRRTSNDGDVVVG